VRIGVDARELCGQPTGVGRYLRALVDQWRSDEQATRHRFIFYAPGDVGFAVGPGWDLRIIRGAAGVWWEQARLPAAARRDSLDVFFAPAYTAPLMLGVPLAVTIHDLSFVAHPEWFRRREGMRRRMLTRAAARRARAVLTVSEFSRREIVDRFRVPEARVHVIPHGAAARPVQQPGTSEPMVLFVGSIFNRRRVPDLIRAFARLSRKRRDVTLEIVGDNRSHPHQDLARIIDEEGLGGRARWRAYVSDAELHGLYARARAFAFLSEYEGFGLTPLEALSAGVPSVLLDTAVARETCGDAALYVPANDVPAVAAALDRVLFDPDVRARLLASAPAVLARYSWPRAARETLRVLEGAAQEK